MAHIHHHTGSTLHWRHNGRDGVSNHRPHHCLLHRLFGRRSKKTSKLRVTGLCAGNSPVTREFPTQMASNRGKCFMKNEDCLRCRLVACSVPTHHQNQGFLYNIIYVPARINNWFTVNWTPGRNFSEISTEILIEILTRIRNSYLIVCISKRRMQNVDHFVWVSIC